MSRSKENPSNKHLGTAQFLFEPKPPGNERPPSASPSNRRRVQSAKASPTTTHQQKTGNTGSSNKASTKRRPHSAFVPKTKPLSSHYGKHKQHNSAECVHVHVPKQFLEFGVSGECADTSTASSAGHHVDKEHSLKSREPPPACKIVSQDLKAHREHKTVLNEDQPILIVLNNQDASSLPQGIAALQPWLTPGLPVELTGVEPDTCLAFLPSLLGDLEGLPIVPPPQAPHDVLPHKPPPPQLKPFDPKKLFHYDVEKNLPANMKNPAGGRPGTSGHGHIFSLDGKLLHDHSKYNRDRTIDIVRQEIEDLEMLLEGVGRAGSANIVVQYQYEINMLRKEVSNTIIQCQLMRSAMPKEEEPPDLLGLRKFIAEREQVLSKIKARRATCLAELDKLEKSLGLSQDASQG